MSSEQDRELLELAAKAAGMSLRWIGDEATVPYTPEESEARGGIDGFMWNPLTDDGDALRLAVKLGMSVVLAECECCCRVYARDLDDDGIFERFSPDFPDATSPDAATATRRCITRTAAALAKGEGKV